MCIDRRQNLTPKLFQADGIDQFLNVDGHVVVAIGHVHLSLKGVVIEISGAEDSSAPPHGRRGTRHAIAKGTSNALTNARIADAEMFGSCVMSKPVFTTP